MKTVRLGLVGKDVSKSTSGKIHKFILNEWGIACEYEKISASPDEFDLAIRRLLGDFDGFNVTIPYKRDIFEYLDEIKGTAFSCGAVNTVISQTREGFNTDAEGFALMLACGNIEIKDKKVLIIGAGGAGRSSAAALKERGAIVAMYRRNQEELHEVCSQLGVRAVSDPEIGGFDILVNCSGVGMHDTVGRSPVSEKAFRGASVAVDLIYEPKESAFLALAKAQGLRTLNGSAMLFYQAYYADCLFVGRQAQIEEAKALYGKYLQNGG